MLSETMAWGWMALVLYVVIGMHELGHFFAMRWFGVKPERLMCGFGPVLVSVRRYVARDGPAGFVVSIPCLDLSFDWWTQDRVTIFSAIRRYSKISNDSLEPLEDAWTYEYGSTFEWRIIPLGGAVMGEFLHLSSWRKIAIAFAGPAASILTFAPFTVLQIAVSVAIDQGSMQCMSDMSNENSIFNLLQIHTAVARCGASVAPFWVAVTSLVVGIVNLHPIPYLDGGRIAGEVIGMIVRRKTFPVTLRRAWNAPALTAVGTLLFLGVVVWSLVDFGWSTTRYAYERYVVRAVVAEECEE